MYHITAYTTTPMTPISLLQNKAAEHKGRPQALYLKLPVGSNPLEKAAYDWMPSRQPCQALQTSEQLKLPCPVVQTVTGHYQQIYAH